ncbi:hypothetical protein [Sphingomonas morindae]|uniref:Rod shape-determining protein MreD n=1 Tax=Sphingomonas morindae TaxID=1541170 RepID=A0ABY4XCG2_9SPHN|nr:hypothetical protein [Sphingomonas morindae]USI74641.1 hypothetical protein LHA26_01485 [Sphingomonas morindae]
MPLPHQILYVATVIAVCGYTLWAGGWPERAGLAIVVAASLASFVAAEFRATAWYSVMPITFLIDLATCATFFVLMVRSDRFWPIWSFGFCVAMVMAHLTRMLRTVLPAWSYYHTTGLWAYPVMASILLGALSRQRRRRSTRRI